jgi:hypothetical protein
MTISRIAEPAIIPGDQFGKYRIAESQPGRQVGI